MPAIAENGRRQDQHEDEQRHHRHSQYAGAMAHQTHLKGKGVCWCCRPICLFIYLFIDLLKAYRPVNRTGSPQGFSQVQISHKLNTIQDYTLLKRKTYKHNPKVSPFGISLVKKEKKGK